MLADGIDVMGALFGVWRAGAVYVPLNPRLSDDEIAHVLRKVELTGDVLHEVESRLGGMGISIDDRVEELGDITAPQGIVRVDDAGVIAEIPDRAMLRRGQTPQAFRLSVLREAYRLAADDPGFQASDR